MRYEYKPRGVCSRKIIFDLENNIVTHMEVEGGCHGNLQGICSLVKGMAADEIVQRLGGIRCGMKPTSCPDQIALAVKDAASRQ